MPRCLGRVERCRWPARRHGPEGFGTHPRPPLRHASGRLRSNAFPNNECKVECVGVNSALSIEISVLRMPGMMVANGSGEYYQRLIAVKCCGNLGPAMIRFIRLERWSAASLRSTPKASRTRRNSNSPPTGEPLIPPEWLRQTTGSVPPLPDTGKRPPRPPPWRGGFSVRDVDCMVPGTTRLSDTCVSF